MTRPCCTHCDSTRDAPATDWPISVLVVLGALLVLAFAAVVL